jgi:hypothetical protein
MSWLIVGILDHTPKDGLAPFRQKRELAPRDHVPGLTVDIGAHATAQNQIAPSAPGAEGRLAFAEDRGGGRGHAPMI